MTMWPFKVKRHQLTPEERFRGTAVTVRDPLTGKFTSAEKLIKDEGKRRRKALQEMRRKAGVYDAAAFLVSLRGAVAEMLRAEKAGDLKRYEEARDRYMETGDIDD